VALKLAIWGISLAGNEFERSFAGNPAQDQKHTFPPYLEGMKFAKGDYNLYFFFLSSKKGRKRVAILPLPI